MNEIGWSRKNSKLWEGRAMNLGVVQKRTNNITLTANVVKKVYGLKLTAEEQQLEDQNLKNR